MFIALPSHVPFAMAGDGYADRILRVNLTKGTVREIPYRREWKEQYIGGRGLGVRILFDLVDPATDPLGDGNAIALAAGPLTGSGMPLGSRYSAVAKSPLTGTLASSSGGGFFGTGLKRAGIDAVVVEGRAVAPVYLWIRDGGCEIRDASAFWETTTDATIPGIQEDLGEPKARVACIGPAGERLARIASLMNDNGRAAGRGGLGAVFGSKRLKAVTVLGEGKVPPADPAEFARVRDTIREKLEKSGVDRGGLGKYGTAAVMNLMNEARILPTRNFQESHFEKAEAVSGERLAETILERVTACYSCSVACGRETRAGGVKGHGPEYETLWALGPDCGVSNLTAIARANYLCNQLGLDTISTGSTIACAMELSARGWIREDIRFGDENAIVDLVRLMGYREGIGEALSEGSLRFARAAGHPELSMSVKGLELPGYDPRGLQGQGLEYATSVRGACHVYGNMIYPEVLGVPVKLDPAVDEGKAGWVKRLQDLAAALDSAGTCLFTFRALVFADYAAMIAAVTGIPFTEETLLRAGERTWTLQKLFNLGAGFTREDDTLPPRLMAEPAGQGTAGGKGWRREPLLSEYYRVRGWDPEGRPSKEKLAELGVPGAGSLGTP
ncbi:MAG: aldehyde ferredoxin oxidoreductase family protein [Methanomicrobiales archaeon]|nr:aldehyde ferredoxin oxidoreductase family protein [Methanomicrobiales archaeon]